MENKVIHLRYHVDTGTYEELGITYTSDARLMNQPFSMGVSSRGYGVRGSKIETLPPGKGFDALDDIEYFQRKVWTSLKIPDSYLIKDAIAVYKCVRLSDVELNVINYDRAMKIVG